MERKKEEEGLSLDGGREGRREREREGKKDGGRSNYGELGIPCLLMTII